MRLITKLASLLLFASLVPLVAGCMQTAMFYHGAPVTSVPVVALREGPPVAGTWETFDLVINYTYQRNGDTLELSGQAALSQHYQTLYPAVSRMRTYLFFVDQDSRVLETVNFVKVWTSGTEDIQRFSKSYQVPAGTAGISFGYSGAVQGEDSVTSFSELPLGRQ